MSIAGQCIDRDKPMDSAKSLRSGYPGLGSCSRLVFSPVLREKKMFNPGSRPPRFPQVGNCTWSDPDKCRASSCRFSVLSDRPRIQDWAPEDLDELVFALPSTCALELASLGPMLLDEIATVLGLARPRIEQIELQATRKLARLRALRRAHWDGY
jgi:hypothetical protein